MSGKAERGCTVAVLGRTSNTSIITKNVETIPTREHAVTDMPSVGRRSSMMRSHAAYVGITYETPRSKTPAKTPQSSHSRDKVY